MIIYNNFHFWFLQNQLAQQGIITAQQKDELLRKHLEAEQNLQKVHNHQRDSQISHLKDKLAERRKKKLAKLRAQQEQELSDVSNSNKLFSPIIFLFLDVCLCLSDQEPKTLFLVCLNALLPKTYSLVELWAME